MSHSADSSSAPTGSLPAAPCAGTRESRPPCPLIGSWACWLLALGLMAGGPALSVAPPARADEPNSLNERRERLEHMTEQELAELRRKKERFDRLSPVEQERLRQLHTDLSADPNCNRLKQLLASYSAWLQTLTAAERAELMSLPPDERVRQIRSLQQDQRRDEADRLGIPSVTISREDARIVLAWMDQYVVRNRPYIEQHMPKLAERMTQISDPKRQSAMLAFALAQIRSEGTAPPPPLESSDLAPLLKDLSAPSREQLESAPTAKDKFDLLLKWCRAAFFRQFEPTREELEKYYRESLSPEDREWLDAMPRQRFQQTLRSMYFRERSMAEGGRGFPGGRPRPGLPGVRPLEGRPLEGRPLEGRPLEGKGPFFPPPPDVQKP